MLLHVQLDARPDRAGERAQELAATGVDGLFTFEGQHDVFLPLAAAASTTAAVCSSRKRSSPVELMTNVAIALPRSPLHLEFRGEFTKHTPMTPVFDRSWRVSRSEFCSFCGPNGLGRGGRVFFGGPARLGVGVSVDRNCRACHRGSRDNQAWPVVGPQRSIPRKREVPPVRCGVLAPVA
jgi:hypothetical protein